MKKGLIASLIGSFFGICAGEFDDNGLRGGLSGLTWSDWDGKQVCHPYSFSIPASEDEVIQIIERARKEKRKVKVVGAGHSFSAIALSDGAYYLSLDRLRAPKQIQPIDTGALVTVEAGIRLFELNEYLENNGLSLANLGATAEQSLAGAISTGTHGTGRKLGSVSTQVRELRIVKADGTVVTASEDENQDLFQAARVGLGALGIITEITIHAVPLFKLREDTISISYDRLQNLLPELMKAHERLQWFFFPLTDQNATLLLRTETQDSITPGGCWERKKNTAGVTIHAETGGLLLSSCVDVSYKALCDSREGYMKRKLYTEMEMFIPADQAIRAVEAFVSKMQAVRGEVIDKGTVFTGVRYVAEDDLWLSPQFGRDTAVISFIVEGTKQATGNQTLFEELGKTLEEIAMKNFHGVPHWGKQNYLHGANELERQYPMFARFNQLRREMDPEGMFMNEYLEQRLVSKAPPPQDWVQSAFEVSETVLF